jgi:hypothetical protein
MEGNLVGALNSSQVLGSQAHDGVGTLLQVSRTDIDVDYAVMSPLIPLLLTTK